jgi:hypothetical protein
MTTLNLDQLTIAQVQLVLALIETQREACAAGQHVVVNGVCNTRRGIARIESVPQSVPPSGWMRVDAVLAWYSMRRPATLNISIRARPRRISIQDIARLPGS